MRFPLEAMTDEVPDISDSSGIGLDQYLTLQLDRGGITNPGMFLDSKLADWVWDIHHAAFENLMWLVRAIFSFEWVDLLAGPLVSLSETMNDLTLELKVVIIGLGLALSAAVYGYQLIKGKAALGITNLLVTLLIASLLSSVFMNPWSTFFKEDGWFDSFKTAGSQTAALFVDGGNETEEISADQVITQDLGSTFVDTLVREPYQLISFGKILTGECDQVFNEELATVTPGDKGDDSVMKAVGKCDEQAKFFMENPTGQLDILAGASIMLQSFYLFTAFCAFLIFVSFLFLGFKVLMLLWQCILGIFPGSDRSGLWKGFLGCIASMIFVTFSVALMAIHLKFTQSLMTALEPLGAKKYLIVVVSTIFGIVLVVVFHRWLAKKSKALAQKLSQALASGGGSSSRSGPSSASRAIHSARSAASTARGISRTSSAISAGAAARSSAASARQANSSQEEAPAPKKAEPNPAAAPNTKKRALGKVAKFAATKVPALAPVAAAATTTARGVKAVKTGVRTAKGRVASAPEAVQEKRGNIIRSQMDAAKEKEGARQEKIHTKLDRVEGRQAIPNRNNHRALTPREHKSQARLQQRSERLHQRLEPPAKRSAKHEQLQANLQVVERRIASRKQQQQQLADAASKRREHSAATRLQAPKPAPAGGK